MTLRTWATPLTVGAFLLISATGVPLFFRLETGLGKAAHEWLGWALLFAVAAHLWLNRRAFAAYFARPAAVAILGASAALLAAVLVAPAGEGRAAPVRQVLGALARAPISTLAQVAKRDETSLLDALAARHPGATPDQSLTELAGGDAVAATALLSEVFAEDPAR